MGRPRGGRFCGARGRKGRGPPLAPGPLRSFRDCLSCGPSQSPLLLSVEGLSCCCCSFSDGLSALPPCLGVWGWKVLPSRAAEEA